MVEAIKKAASTKIFKGWKTLAFNGVMGVIPALEIIGQLMDIPEIKGIIPVEYLPYYVAGMAGVNVVLRGLTTTPVGKKF